MKITAKQSKWVEVFDGEIVIDVPEESITFTSNYCKVMVIPQWTTWNIERFQKPEEIFGLDVIWLDKAHGDGEIVKFSFSLHPSTINSLLMEVTNRNRIDSLRRCVLDYLIQHTDKEIPHRDYLSRQEFIASYQAMISELNHELGIVSGASFGLKRD